MSFRYEFRIDMSVTINAKTMIGSSYLQLLVGGLNFIYVICVCLRIVVSNTYYVVFLFCLSLLCCQFLWIVHFWQTIIYKSLHRKLKIEQHEPHKKSRMNSSKCSGRVGSSCFRGVTVVIRSLVLIWQVKCPSWVISHFSDVIKTRIPLPPHLCFFFFCK